MKSVAGHGPGWSSLLFVFEDCNGDIGKFLPRNTERCKLSEFMLKAEIKIEFQGQSTPLPTLLDVLPHENCKSQ